MVDSIWRRNRSDSGDCSSDMKCGKVDTDMKCGKVKNICISKTVHQGK